MITVAVIAVTAVTVVGLVCADLYAERTRRHRRIITVALAILCAVTVVLLALQIPLPGSAPATRQAARAVGSGTVEGGHPRNEHAHA